MFKISKSGLPPNWIYTRTSSRRELLSELTRDLKEWGIITFGITLKPFHFYNSRGICKKNEIKILKMYFKVGQILQQSFAIYPDII